MKFTILASIIIWLQFYIVDAALMGSTNSIKDDKIMEVTCLGRYTGVFHSFIYFSNNETDTDLYVIRTSWLLTYPSKIRNELKKNNMSVFSNYDEKCGWTLVSAATNIGIPTGNVYFKNNRNTKSEKIALQILYSNYPTLEIMLIVVFCGIPLLIIGGLIYYIEA